MGSKCSKKISKLVVPEKIYLNNTNLMHSIRNQTNIGSCRETFFASMLTTNHEISLPTKGVFFN